MGQLNLFEVPTTTLIATQLNGSIDILSPTTERVAESKEIIESGLAPTWEVHYYDKAKRSRIDWIRSETEIQASQLLREKVKDNVYFVDKVVRSKRSLEEIEMLD
ncbi:hypothetical protein P9Z84_29255 [Bacillus cereus]|uniref:hypothetical protein n=1 Tax=Bacillus thuringiensis TaxID=1428 RepID=UPI000BF40D1F|nr:hypothetical protein [Bacillus thuringiensis]MEC3196738.1 hypothetical protein [Bacillus cereus]PEV88450.1 hypothetical protein CN442_20860 [Bacillus thuringiensis]PFK90994.1 hypothetical protein COJ04_21605 [Bacillus thuringiensis]